MSELDFRKQQCPTPVIETRKALLEDPTQPRDVLVGDDMALENVSRLGRTLGFAVSHEPVDAGFRIHLEPGDDADKSEKAPASCGSLVLVTSEVLGSGDDDLGRVLLRNFLITLEQSESTPDKVYFVNGGVKLTCEGSEALEPLKELADKGVDVASCGLCLDFYHLKDSLKVGRSTNMLDIVESLQSAARVIRP